MKRIAFRTETEKNFYGNIEWSVNLNNIDNIDTLIDLLDKGGYKYELKYTNHTIIELKANLDDVIELDDLYEI